MSDIAISVENLGKAYRIGLKEQQHETMLGAVAAWIKSPLQNFRDVRNLSRFTGAPEEALGSAVAEKPPSDVFWALKDVSFEVKRGEAVGIIGRNGAGKSTLLKILSRITEPTSGRAKIHGRVGSLLEVGTGFHPDLTGRENVYLNGTILGMKKREIDAKFDEIVAFSGVEKFIDTPVKRYSSGMRVRLAFSVAAHLEPEILILDEVLAVGDADFQRRCLGKMEEVASQGRTVIFVSHNMGAVTSICDTALLLKDGMIASTGLAEKIIAKYLQAGDAAEATRKWNGMRRRDFLDVGLSEVRILNSEGEITTNIDAGENFSVEVCYTVQTLIPAFRTAIRLLTAEEIVVFTSSDSGDSRWGQDGREAGNYTSKCDVPGYLLNEGSYLLTVSADIPNSRTLFQEERALAFTVYQTSSLSSVAGERWPGVICPKLNWSVKHETGEARGRTIPPQ